MLKKLQYFIFLVVLQYNIHYVMCYDDDDTISSATNVTCDNIEHHQKVLGDIAIVYELNGPLTPIAKIINSIIRDYLFIYPGNPYALGLDADCYRATKVAPIAYPGAGWYMAMPTTYGEPLNNEQMINTMGNYGSTYPPDNNTLSIDNGLSYVLRNLNRSKNAAGDYLPRFILLFAHDNSTVDDAYRTAKLLKNEGALIITVAVDSDADFSKLSSGQSFTLKIRNQTDDFPIVQQIGDILVSMSSMCFKDGGQAKNCFSTTTATNQGTSTTSSNNHQTSMSHLSTTTKFSYHYERYYFSLIIVTLVVFVNNFY